MKTYYDKNLDDYIYSTGIVLSSVVNVDPKPDYTLLLTFSNGEKKIYDVNPLLKKEVFKALKNSAFFMTARVLNGTVVWSEEIDIDPEELYEQSVVFAQ